MRITADTITDEQIEALFDSLEPGHYARQWCLDARFPSASHPHRHKNARREVARILNERNAHMVKP